jgi:coenzyme F420-dependent glucose-6-phosphate dehydrogenase
MLDGFQSVTFLAKIEISANLGENDFDPKEFVDAAVYAEEVGFQTVWFGDHIFPWYHSGKRSSFVWSMMPAALERTDKIKVGPWVTVPTGARYHPAIIAQASATLDNMYPGRLILGFGTGEALNERPFWNDRWPKWEERMERMTEGIRLIREMWESGEPFKFEGKYFSSDFYCLYTKPRRNIPIYASAIGKKAAYAAGVNTEGLITLSPRNNTQKLKDVILPEYMRGRSATNKKGLGKVAIELIYSFRTPEDLLKNEWRTLGIWRKDSWSAPNPVEVEKEGAKVTKDDLRSNMHFCKDWKDIVKLIEAYQEVGVNEVNISTGCTKKMIRSVAKNVHDVF